VSEDREIMWLRVEDDRSTELLRVAAEDAAPGFSGTVLAAEDGSPLRVEYRVVCDRSWATRHVTVTQQHRGGRRTLRLEHDGAGAWRRDGHAAPALDGCSDVDLGISPSTNALPINRLRLAVGGTATIRAAWVLFPALDVVAAEQSYERLAVNRYRYRSVDSGFEAVIEVDDRGFAIDYADLWHRIAEGTAAPRLG